VLGGHELGEVLLAQVAEVEAAEALDQALAELAVAARG
jgi:hypothetical protein